MEPGICYIKREYLLEESKEKESAVPNNKRKLETDVENAEGPTTVELTDQNGEANKYQKTDKRGKRKRGQNKKRPIFKDIRTLHLCHSLINGPTKEESEKCTYSNCRYVHDLQEYLDCKGEDLGEECFVYNTKGYCARGVTCRFAKAHLDEAGRNIKAAHYVEAELPTTCNGISTELQVRLRKREFDFSKSKELVTQFEKLRSALKEEKATTNKTVEAVEPKEIPTMNTTVEKVEPTEEPTTNTTVKTVLPAEKATLVESIESVAPAEKPIGAAVDDDITAGRDVLSKPPVDFTNKLLLSPLTTVGNLPFRRICKEFGADITCGEMACSVPLVKGLTQEWALTKRHESEDIFGVQLCGNNANTITQAAQLMHEYARVDFIDLNIGCPIDLIYQQGGGSALMRRNNVLELTVRSCAAFSPQLPFTVKMRTGVYADKSVAHELVPLVEEWGAAAVTLHGRSREQRYTKHANWAYIEECAAKAKRMPVMGNGDILNFEDYNEKKLIAPHVSSVMIGRGALIKPWIFQELKQQQHWHPTSTQRYDILRKYVNYGLEHWGSDTKGVENTRRFLLEWQSFLYRYIPYDLLELPPQKINQRPQKFRGRDEMETLLSSPSSTDWVKLSEMLLGPVPVGFTFVPKHKANSY